MIKPWVFQTLKSHWDWNLVCASGTGSSAIQTQPYCETWALVHVSQCAFALPSPEKGPLESAIAGGVSL